MNCMVCRGACCETFHIRDVDIRVEPDVRRWIELHTITMEPDRSNNLWLEFPVPCSKLITYEEDVSDWGRCSIYEDRPQVCRDLRPGDKDCLDAVRKRRTAEQYTRIAGQDDPRVIHW